MKAWIRVWNLKTRFGSWLFRYRKKRRKGELATKYFYLNAGDVAYRIARGCFSSKEYEDRLDKYYPQLVSAADTEDASLRFYFIIMAASVLAHYGAISEVSSFGVKISLTAIKQVLLFALASSICWVGMASAKKTYLSSLFTRYIKVKNGQDKADLLARYPRAFMFSDYYVRAIGGPSYLARLTMPWQMIIILIFLVAGLLLYLAFTTWIFVVIAVDVWNAPVAEFGGWNKALVLVSAGLACSAYLMPSSFFKRRHAHTGMASLMARIEKKDPERHKRYLLKIIAAAKRMQLHD